MKKQDKILNKKIMLALVFMLVVIMCFSPKSYAEIEVYHEILRTEEDGKELEETKSVLILDVLNECKGGVRFNITNKPGPPPEGQKADNLFTSFYYDNSGNGGEVKDVVFIAEYTDDTGTTRRETIAYTNDVYYQDGEGYIIRMNKSIYSGELFIQFIDASGNPNVVHIGTIGGDINVKEHIDTDEDPGFLRTLWNLIVDTAQEISRLVEEIVVELLLPLGDGILYLVTSCVGETVTIDRLVFNGVGKVDIDYWNGITPGSRDIKAVMSGVVTAWYKVFYKIAVIVYIIILIVVGIQILLNSTAEKKAKYKDVFVSWLVGVMMLTLFPFVLKYIVQINGIAVKAMCVYINGSELASTNEPPDILKMPISQAMSTFGNVEFVDAMLPQKIVQGNKIIIADVDDSMLQTRLQAQFKKKVALVGVYFILLGQMIVLLFMYYKRAFMIAFLITIFPLVAMTYAVDKIGDKKAQSFGIWFKEYIVNVVVQIFHATVYVLIVGAGIQSYINSQGATWLFMIISVLFLFQGEKILRNIFGIKSSANTMADLAATGAAIYGISKISGKGGNDKNIGSKQDNADVSEATERQNQRNSYGAHGAPVPPELSAGSGGTQDGDQGDGEDTSRNQGMYTGNDPAGVETAGYNEGAAQDSVIQKAMSRRLGRGFASGAVNFAGKALGVTAGVSYGLSKGDTADGSMLKNAISDGVSGKMIGSAVAAPATAVVNKVEQKVHGEHLAQQIEDGDMDKNLTLNVPAGAMMPPNVDPTAIVGKHGETMQEIYRKALAEMARVTATKGKARGEVAYWNFIEENMDNSGN